ncbi:MAG: HEAT repeat domain-containing protein [Planctomycetes bacterium]|nr:HEAT repeat domain-containing protein [Planctomycetota bacterium]
MLLAAIAAATLFVDFRLASIATESTNLRNAVGLGREQAAADSQVLASLAATMDAVPRRKDLDDVVARIDALSGAGTAATVDVQKQVDQLKADLLALATAHRVDAEASRLLLEDVRQRQVRVLEAIHARAAVVGESPTTRPGPDPMPNPPSTGETAKPPEDVAPPALPPALAEQVKKLQSADPATRFEGVDELLKTKDLLALPFLLPMARDADAFVRRLTVEGLAAWKRADVVDSLLGALADGDEYVRETAWRSLKEVTGQKIAFEAAGSKDARARGVQRWQDWWEKNKATFGS